VLDESVVLGRMDPVIEIAPSFDVCSV